MCTITVCCNVYTYGMLQCVQLRYVGTDGPRFV